VSFEASGRWLADSEGQVSQLIDIDHAHDHSGSRALPTEYWNCCYEGWSGFARIDWPREGRTLEIVADPVFGRLMTHVPQNSPDVFCLEPQSVPPCGFDGLESGIIPQGVVVLEEGQSFEGSVKFRINTA
jgi:aldose 1-epimerase